MTLSPGFMQDDYEDERSVEEMYGDGFTPIRWVRRDGTMIRYEDMTRHHAWNAERMQRRAGRKVWPLHRARVGDLGVLRTIFYHAWNAAWLLAHPWKINRCTLRGL